MNRPLLFILLMMVLTIVVLCFVLDITVSPDRFEARWQAPAVLAVITFVGAVGIERTR